jgi:uncharacterized membrane protein
MDQSMMGMMMGNMIAGVLFALVIVVALVWQVVLQRRLLAELRQLRADKTQRAA